MLMIFVSHKLEAGEISGVINTYFLLQHSKDRTECCVFAVLKRGSGICLGAVVELRGKLVSVMTLALFYGENR